MKKRPTGASKPALEDAVRQALKSYGSPTQPSAGFARRTAALAVAGDDPLRWVAWRLVPASLGLVLVLSWLNLRSGETLQAEIAEDPTEVVLAWMLDPTADDSE